MKLCLCCKNLFGRGFDLVSDTSFGRYDFCFDCDSKFGIVSIIKHVREVKK